MQPGAVLGVVVKDQLLVNRRRFGLPQFLQIVREYGTGIRIDHLAVLDDGLCILSSLRAGWINLRAGTFDASVVGVGMHDIVQVWAVGVGLLDRSADPRVAAVVCVVPAVAYAAGVEIPRQLIQIKVCVAVFTAPAVIRAAAIMLVHRWTQIDFGHNDSSSLSKEA